MTQEATDFGVLDDGFGNAWLLCSKDCELQIVRPGKAQCDKCDRLDALRASLFSWFTDCFWLGDAHEDLQATEEVS